MRITSGKHKNKRILTHAKGEKLVIRPTRERVRMGVFNILAHSNYLNGDGLDGGIVADICCGSGAFGIECLSRGAKKAYFVDANHKQIKLVQENVSNIGESQNSILITADATKLHPINDVCDVVFIDPPYNKGLPEKILHSVIQNKWINERTIIIVEMDKNDSFSLNNYELLDERQYGKSKLLFLKVK